MSPATGYERWAPRVYTPAGWPEPLTAEVYRPQDQVLRPGVLVVHGGSWAGRSPADMARICRRLAASGLVAVNVAYRLAPRYLFPAPLRDLQRALDWIVAEAPQLGVDPARLGAFGYSAGAHLVALLALLEAADARHARGRGGYTLRAAVAGGLPADLTAWPHSAAVKQFLGVSQRSDPQLWVEASPLAHVSRASPPFFLYHGELDRVVEPDQSRRMLQRLAAAGVRAELHTAAWHGHLSLFVLNRAALRRATEFLGRTLADGQTG